MIADPGHLTPAEVDEVWDHAVDVADALERAGWIGGNSDPSRCDVERVLRAAIYAGFIPC